MGNPKVLIVGTGAIGSFYGGKLQLSGAEVSTLCRSDYEIVKQNGIKVESVDGDFLFKPHEVINDINDYNSIPDYIIITTKALPEIRVKNILKDKIKSTPTIVLIQNGIDIEKEVQNDFPEKEIISGLAFICVSRIKPGLIKHQDYGRLTIGNYPKGFSEKTKTLKNLFEQSNVNCSIDENIINSRWKKLIWNVPFNPISVIGGGIDTKTILEDENLLELVKNTMEEVVLMANKSGCKISKDLIQQNINSTLKMTPYKTSMLLDYENKRPMEIEAILGNTIKIADELNVSIPHVKTIYALLKILDEGNK